MNCFCGRKVKDDNEFGEDEIEDLVALFAAINISGTGRIDKDEFADLFYHLDLVVSDEYLNKLFNAADKDGSGAIEIGDFLQTFSETKRHEELHEWSLKEKFVMIDQDGDGLLSGAEIKDCMLTNGFEVTEEIIDNLIDEADTNEDGQIRYEEFLEVWKTYGKTVTKDRADSMYDVITSQATDGRIKQKSLLRHINEETMTTKL